MARYALDNADIWLGDGTGYHGHVVVNDDVIETVAPGAAPVGMPRHDLAGMALSPGLIDLMVLGGFGCSIMRDDPLEIARQYLRLGITACQFCTGTLPHEAMQRVGGNVRRARQAADRDAAEVLGLYLEGPFQHPERTGASLPRYALPPTPENIGWVLREVGDVLTMLNISPGTPGDAAAIRQVSAAGKIVSMAHSNAPAEYVLECVEAGTSVLGHVWDNNSGLIGDSGVQQPTIEHVALIDERVRFIHLICDGAHVHPLLIQLVLRCRGMGALCLVTDAVPLAGCADGEFIWDDGRTFVKRHGVGRTVEGALCGGGLLLPDMWRNFINFTKLPPREAIRTITANPATSLGLAGSHGLLAPGRRASLVAWDAQLRVRRVWHHGQEIAGIGDLAEVAIA